MRGNKNGLQSKIKNKRRRSATAALEIAARAIKVLSSLVGDKNIGNPLRSVAQRVGIWVELWVGF